MGTMLPIFVLGLFDQDITATTALNTPILYLDGIRHVSDSTKVFWAWMGEGFIHAIVVAFIPLYAIRKAQLPTDGETAGLYDYGVAVFISVILVVTVRIAFEFRMISAFAGVAMAFCVL